jgi:hypothetical protein
MNIVRNEKLIKRNSRIAQYTLLGGLLVLAGGMFISFRYPQQFALSLGALMLGFILSQVGIYFSNRWGRSPRPDEQIDLALKGMDRKYSLHHYTTPASHLLLGPSGMWVLLPYYQRGTIVFEKGRFKQRGGNFYLKIFAQEGLGRPEMEAAGEVESLNNFLKKRLPEDSLPPVQAALVFTNPRAAIDIPEDANPPVEAVLLKDLKDLVRKGSKNKSLSPEKVKLIEDALGVNQ